MQSVASRVIALCGGHNKVANWLNVAPVTVYRWTYPKSRGGTGGTVPTNKQKRLIDAAKKNKVALTWSDFYPSDKTVGAAE